MRAKSNICGVFHQAQMLLNFINESSGPEELKTEPREQSRQEVSKETTTTIYDNKLNTPTWNNKVQYEAGWKSLSQLYVVYKKHLKYKDMKN